MPSFDLPPAELDSITLLLRSWNAPASESNPPGDRSAGERYFFGAGGCSQCHMAMGRGKAIGPDLSMLGRELTLPEIEESIRQPAARIKARLRASNSKDKGRRPPCEDSRGTEAATTYNSRISRENFICSTQRRSPRSRWNRAR